jgi:hypothetical protein
MDRAWNILRANDGATQLFGRLFAPEPVPTDANVLRLAIEPGPVRQSVRNWASVAAALLEGARREAVGGVLDHDTAGLVASLRDRDDVAEVLASPDASRSEVPVVDVRFAVARAELSFFSVISTIGTPMDVTAQELRIEAFFPADHTTRSRWPEIAADPASKPASKPPAS